MSEFKGDHDNMIKKETEMTELVEGLHVVQRDTGKASSWPTEHTLTVVPGTGVGESTVETLQDRRALAYIN